MSNMSLAKIGGVCAILASILYVVFLVLFFSLVGDIPGREDMGKRLMFFNDHRTSIVYALWFFALAVLVNLVAFVGFHHALRPAGPVLLLGLMASATGFLFATIFIFVHLGMAYQLAPGYVSADAASRPALEVVAKTLESGRSLVDGFAHVLFWGIGVAVYAWASFKTTLVAKWVGWLGLLAALLTGGAGAFESVWKAADITATVGVIVFLVWMVAMGVGLLRRGEPATA